MAYKRKCNEVKIKTNKIVVFCIIFTILISIMVFPITRCEHNQYHSDKNSPDQQLQTANTESINSLSYQKSIYNQSLPNQIIVKFKENINLTFSNLVNHTIRTNFHSINDLNKIYQIIDIKRIYSKNNHSSFSNMYKFYLKNKSNVSEIAKEYNKNPLIAFSQPNYILNIHLSPSDPFYNSSGSWNQSYDDLWGLKRINCEKAWEKTTGSKEIIVGVLDSGIDYNHPDIAYNVWINEDEISNNNVDDDRDGFVDNRYGADFAYDDGNPLDNHGHGTHCAGIIAAVGNNDLGIVGVNWEVKIMAVKAFSNIGLSSSDIIADAIYWAVDNGADVLSNSWGSNLRNPSNPLIEHALEYAEEKGVISVFSAGNDNDDVCYYSPQNMKETITVAATDVCDKKTYFSNWGSKIDLCAPGEDILSLRANDTDMYGDKSHIVHDFLYRASGTSMACSFVSGVCSLILSTNLSLKSQEIKKIICNTVDHVWSPFYIGGRINAHKALMIDNASVHIHSPAMDTNLKGLINIIGTAEGKNFHNYTVDYRKKDDLQNWIRLNSSNKQILHGIIATLNTEKLEDAPYSIRLCVNYDTYVLTDTIDGIINNELTILSVSNDESGDYSSIQTAIDHAGSGDRIYVKSGVYQENIIIDRSLHLNGENRSKTIIENNGNYDILQCYADYVNITCFTFKNRFFKKSGNGILLWNTTDNHIFGNVITNIKTKNILSDVKSCIVLVNATKNKITGNDLFNNTGYAIKLYDSSHNSICGNNYHDNSMGIVLSYSSDFNDFSGNDANNNTDFGISIISSSSNIIRFNNFIGNQIGIIIDKGSFNNSIYENNFFENRCNTKDYGDNQWNNLDIMKGNYWDDYRNKYPEALDQNNDGIWDIPYQINGTGNYDLYPLVTSLILKPPNKPLIIDCDEEWKIREGKSYNYSFQGVDSTGQKIRYYIDWGNGEICNSQIFYSSGEIAHFDHVFSKKGSYQLRIKTVNEDGRVSQWSDSLVVTVSIQKTISQFMMQNFEPALEIYRFLYNFYQFIFNLLINC